MAGVKGRGGSNRVPSALKALRGTDRPCRTNPDEPRVVVCEPEIPSGLEAPALARWRWWVPILLDLGVLSADCGPALASLIRSELRVNRARRDYRKHGAIAINDGVAERTAYARELDSAEAEFRRWCIEFGVTPASRTRVRATQPSKPAETEADRAAHEFFGS